jgi:putative hydrolase of the HAD superfamily
MVLDAVVFDFGGTLVYHGKTTEDLIRLGYQSMTDYLKSRGLNVELDKVIEVSNGIYNAYSAFAEKSFVELDSRRIYPAILYQLGAAEFDDEDLISGVTRSFYAPIVDDYCLYKDARHVLEWLRKRKLKIGLVSNNQSTDFHSLLLQKHDLWNYFASIVVSSVIGIRKPHKQIFLRCLTQLKAKPENTIFVGDEPIHDVQGAKNAGMRCIWIKRKDWTGVQVQPDWTVKSLIEIEEIITTLMT